jgi:hypothetical protein
MIKRAAIVAVKAFHSLVFLVLQTLICYLLYKGVKGDSDRRAGLATVVISTECLVYAGNGFRCPLTAVAENLGAESGSVTDIFLPRWLASNIANIYAPLFALALLLHGRNVWRRSRHV